MRLINFATSGDLAIGDPYWCFLIDKKFNVFLDTPLRGNTAYVNLDAGLDRFKELAIERMKLVEKLGCELVTKDSIDNSELRGILLDFYWVQDQWSAETGESEKNLAKLDLSDSTTFKLLALLMGNKNSLNGGKKSLANLFGNTIRMLVKHRNVESDVALTTKGEGGEDIELVPMEFLREHGLIEGDPLNREDFNPITAIFSKMPLINDERPALQALFEEGNIPWFVWGECRFDCPGEDAPRALQFFVAGRPTQ